MKDLTITASIVLYQTKLGDLVRVIDSVFLTSQNLKLILVDNSPTDELKQITLRYPLVQYLHNPSNPGFGAAHNIAIDLATQEGSKYHFIINPDIHFDKDVITPMVNYMQYNLDVGMMMPKVLNEDGTIQYLPKLLPSLFWILRRKLKKIDFNHQRFIDKYELRKAPQNLIFNSPLLSGCFTLLNLKAIQEVGPYDDQFFMYFEDFDLSRRMHQRYKTIYFPEVFVYHGYESGANKSSKLFKIFIKSAFAYFNKWGWFFDADRKKINKEALAQFI